MQANTPRSSTPNVAINVFRVGDSVSYFVLRHSPQSSRADINEGVIIKIKEDRATLKLPNGRSASVFLRCLSPNGPTHTLSRAFSRCSTRWGHGRSRSTSTANP